MVQVVTIFGRSAEAQINVRKCSLFLFKSISRTVFFQKCFRSIHLVWL